MTHPHQHDRRGGRRLWHRLKPHGHDPASSVLRAAHEIAADAEHQLTHEVPYLVAAATVHTDPDSHPGAHHHPDLSHHRHAGDHPDAADRREPPTDWSLP